MKNILVIGKNGQLSQYFCRSFEEEFTFWAMVYIFEDLNMKNVLSNKLDGLIIMTNAI